jgi:hypothetical protein
MPFIFWFSSWEKQKCNLSVLAVPATKSKNAILSVLRCHFICAAMPFYLCCDTILIGLADAIHPFWSQCPRFHVEAKSSMPFYLCCDAILSVLAFGSDFGLRRWKAKMPFICASTDAILSVLPMPFMCGATV